MPRRGDSEAWVARFAAGLGKAIVHFGCPLLGGDTIAGLERWTLSLTAFGLVPTGLALGRAGAKQGDLICVSGMLGEAGLGLAALQAGKPQEAWVARYRTPTPRLALGQALRGVASACADISDGLLADAGHIGLASGLGVEIELELVPHPAFQNALEAATAGDDYELVFTLPPNKADALLTLSKDLGLMLSVVGRMTDGSGVRVRDADGSLITPERLGFQHG
jgi:thiamine-monophosphate kinase